MFFTNYKEIYFCKEVLKKSQSKLSKFVFFKLSYNLCHEKFKCMHKHLIIKLYRQYDLDLSFYLTILNIRLETYFCTTFLNCYERNKLLYPSLIFFTLSLLLQRKASLDI